jgi:hypothetical protein
VKLLKGKRLKSVMLSETQPILSVYFSVGRPASVSICGKGWRERGILGCVIALLRIHRAGLRNAARLLLGWPSGTYALRMLA